MEVEVKVLPLKGDFIWMLHAAKRNAKDQGMTCVCKSGLPILAKGTLEGKWVGYCRKCKPKTGAR